jgi:hypothetical protein
MGDQNIGFHIVLSSEHCKDIYPDNKMSNFKVRLPKKLNLDHNWRVALTEIKYTNSLFTFEETQYITLSTIGSITRIPFKPQLYDTVEELVEDIKVVLRGQTDLQHPPLITVEEGDRVVVKDGSLNKAGKTIPVKLSFSETLHNILGIDRNGRAFLNAGRTNILVYSSIVAPRIVGHMSVPLLYVVDAQNTETFGSTISHVYKTPHYCQLADTDIDEIEIQLLDDSGRSPNFKYGEVVLGLHFKNV